MVSDERIQELSILAMKYIQVANAESDKSGSFSPIEIALLLLKENNVIEGKLVTVEEREFVLFSLGAVFDRVYASRHSG